MIDPTRHPSGDPRAYQESALELASWALPLFLRTDAYGGYRPQSEWKKRFRKDGRTAWDKVICHKNPISRERLEQHFRGMDPSDLCGPYTTSLQNTCLFGAFDLDDHDGTCGARATLEDALVLAEVLEQYGLKCLIEASSPTSVHVWIFFDQEVPSVTLYALLQKVLADAGIQAETFPKQPELAAGQYGNFLRLPGRHHTEDHWSSVWSFEQSRWLTGDDAIRALRHAPHNSACSLPTVELPAAPEVTPDPTETKAYTPRQLESEGLRYSDAEIVRRCLPYLKPWADTYDRWVLVGQIMKHAGCSVEEWDAWSSQSGAYVPDARECFDKWPSFDKRTAGRLATVGTLVHHARKNGGLIRVYKELPAPTCTAPKPTAADTLATPSTPPAEKPTVVLPGGDIPITKASAELGALLAKTGRFYTRGGALTAVDQEDNHLVLKPVPVAALPTIFESVANLAKLNRDGEPVPATCSEVTAKLIAHAAPFLEALPPIRVLAPCPVLVDRGDALKVVTGYDRETGILASGRPPEDVTLEEARALLNGAITDFRFGSPSDRSRALAAILAPAMIFGGLLRGRLPVDLGEADDSQTGKGYRNKITAAIYGASVRTVTQKRGGVGSLEESFNAQVVRGHTFICLDNLRGGIDSPALESFLTEDRYLARVPYSGNVEVDPRRIVVQVTSNKADLTADFANRSSCVRMLKHAPGYGFKRYAEGDILEHIRANQRRYLGAVFAVLRAWHQAGKPRTTESRHDFRPWAQAMDWIVQHLLGAAPLLDGHRETQARMASPLLNWLRDLALAVKRQGQFGTPLTAASIVHVLEQDGTVEIPGVEAHADLGDEAVRKQAFQAVGRRMSLCFKGDSSVKVDAIEVTRQETEDPAHARTVRTYLFATCRDVSPDSSDQPEGLKGNLAPAEAGTTARAAGAVISPEAPLGLPLIDSPKKTEISPDSLDEHLQQDVASLSVPLFDRCRKSMGSSGELGGSISGKCDYVEVEV